MKITNTYPVMSGSSSFDISNYFILLANATIPLELFRHIAVLPSAPYVSRVSTNSCYKVILYTQKKKKKKTCDSEASD